MGKPISFSTLALSKAIIDINYSAIRKRKGDFSWEVLLLTLLKDRVVYAYKTSSETAPLLTRTSQHCKLDTDSQE